MSSLSATYTFAAPYSPSCSLTVAAVPGAPMTTALGSPSSFAAVSSSNVAFLTVPCPASTRTSTSAMSVSFSSPRSDQLLGREVVGDLHAAVTLVLDLLTGFARRCVLERLDRGARVGEADLAGIHPDV